MIKKTVLFFLLASTLFGSMISNTRIKSSRLMVLNSREYKYRGEVKFEFIGEKKGTFFTLEPVEDRRFKILSYKVYKNNEFQSGPVYRGEGNGETYKINFEIELDEQRKGWDKEKVNLFVLKGTNGSAGTKYIQVEVTELKKASVEIRGKNLSFGKVYLNEALKKGARSKKNSEISLTYEVDKKINNGNIHIVYPKEIYINNLKAMENSLKIILEDNAKLEKREFSQERVLKLPIRSKKDQYSFEISGYIKPEEFKDKELGKYRGDFRVRAYYDFIVDEELKRNNVEFVKRR